jgi:cell division protein FtsW (lipid II flippase)
MSQGFKKVFDLRNYRWSELFLLIMPTLFILLGMFQLQLISANANGKTQQAISVSNLPALDVYAPQLLLIVALFATHVVLSWLAPNADRTLLPIAGMLSAIGVLEATRLGPALLPVPESNLGIKQLVWVLIGMGFCIATVFATRSLRWLRLYKYTWALLGIVLVAITLIHAHNVNFDSPTHDQLNLGIGSLVFQPSELLKICLVVFYAAYLAENREILADEGRRFGPIYVPPLKHMGPLVVMLLIALVMFVGLRELGLALLIFGIFVSMIYLASGRMAYVYYSLAGFAVGAFIAYGLFSYVRDRVAVVSTAFQPDTALGTGYQIVQGLIAMGNGGILGQGFGLGHPTFVPAVQTDFVAAAVGEEFGMAGLFAVLGIFMLLVYRSFRIAIRARDTFEQLLAGGIGSVFAIQTLVILAGNLKLMPLTGIPLPFITYGGSSVIANFIMIGLLLRLSTPAADQAA